jgi:signal transduction histidine kinase
MVDEWLRHAELRAANLFYLAGDPSPAHRERALVEMTKALREALEEVRVVVNELRREADTRLSGDPADAPRQRPIRDQEPPNHRS